MAKPKFQITASDKATKGKFLEIGALWESDQFPGTYNLSLEDGVSITVTRAYSKEAKTRVDIKAEVVTAGKDGTHWLNVRPPYEKKEASELERVARTTFSTDDFNFPVE